MENQVSRIEILQACPGLSKHEEYQKVFVTPDLTRKQQRNDILLRDKLRDFREGGENNIRIKKGKIVKYLDGKEVVLYAPLIQ